MAIKMIEFDCWVFLKCAQMITISINTIYLGMGNIKIKGIFIFIFFIEKYFFIKNRN